MMADETAKIGVARAMLAAWDVRDWERVLALFAEDAVLHSMMIEPIVGRHALGGSPDDAWCPRTHGQSAY